MQKETHLHNSQQHQLISLGELGLITQHLHPWTGGASLGVLTSCTSLLMTELIQVPFPVRAILCESLFSGEEWLVFVRDSTTASVSASSVVVAAEGGVSSVPSVSKLIVECIKVRCICFLGDLQVGIVLGFSSYDASAVKSSYGQLRLLVIKSWSAEFRQCFLNSIQTARGGCCLQIDQAVFASMHPQPASKKTKISSSPSVAETFTAFRDVMFRLVLNRSLITVPSLEGDTVKLFPRPRDEKSELLSSPLSPFTRSLLEAVLQYQGRRVLFTAECSIVSKPVVTAKDEMEGVLGGGHQSGGETKKCLVIVTNTVILILKNSTRDFQLRGVLPLSILGTCVIDTASHKTIALLFCPIVSRLWTEYILLHFDGSSTSVSNNARQPFVRVIAENQREIGQSLVVVADSIAKFMASYGETEGKSESKKMPPRLANLLSLSRYGIDLNNPSSASSGVAQYPQVSSLLVQYPAIMIHLMQSLVPAQFYPHLTTALLSFYAALPSWSPPPQEVNQLLYPSSSHNGTNTNSSSNADESSFSPLQGVIFLICVLEVKRAAQAVVVHQRRPFERLRPEDDNHTLVVGGGDVDDDGKPPSSSSSTSLSINLPLFQLVIRQYLLPEVTSLIRKMKGAAGGRSGGTTTTTMSASGEESDGGVGGGDDDDDIGERILTEIFSSSSLSMGSKKGTTTTTTPISFTLGAVLHLGVLKDFIPFLIEEIIIPIVLETTCVELDSGALISWKGWKETEGYFDAPDRRQSFEHSVSRVISRGGQEEWSSNQGNQIFAYSLHTEEHGRLSTPALSELVSLLGPHWPQLLHHLLSAPFYIRRRKEFHHFVTTGHFSFPCVDAGVQTEVCPIKITPVDLKLYSTEAFRTKTKNQEGVLTTNVACQANFQQESAEAAAAAASTPTQVVEKKKADSSSAVELQRVVSELLQANTELRSQLLTSCAVELDGAALSSRQQELFAREIGQLVNEENVARETLVLEQKAAWFETMSRSTILLLNFFVQASSK